MMTYGDFTREVEIDALFDDEIQSDLNADETREILSRN